MSAEWMQYRFSVFFFQAEDGIRDDLVTGVQTCALPICRAGRAEPGLAGDQEARSSNPVATGSACLAPKPSVTTRVTVPLTCRYPAVLVSSASVSQLQPTCPTSGSAAISGSSSVRT